MFEKYFFCVKKRGKHKEDIDVATIKVYLLLEIKNEISKNIEANRMDYIIEK